VIVRTGRPTKEAADTGSEHLKVIRVGKCLVRDLLSGRHLAIKNVAGRRARKGMQAVTWMTPVITSILGLVQLVKNQAFCLNKTLFNPTGALSGWGVLQIGVFNAKHV